MEITEQHWEQSRSYQRWRRAAPAIVLVPLITWLVWDGGATPTAFVRFLEAEYPDRSDGLYLLAIFIVLAVLSLFSSVPRFFVMRRFGLLQITASQFAKLCAKRLAVMAMYLFPLGLWLRFASLHFENPWPAVGSGIAVVMSAHFYLCAVTVLPFYVRTYDLPAGALRDRLTAFAKSTGVREIAIKILQTSDVSNVANAAVAGIGKHRTLFLTDTLIRDFSEDEIEAIAAHELGHMKHHHLLWRNVLFVLLTAGFSLLFSFALPFSESIRDLEHFHSLLLYGLMMWAWSVIVLNPLSRRQEFQADAYAVAHLNAPDVYPRALSKIHAGALILTGNNAPTHPALQKRLRKIHEIITGRQQARTTTA